MKKSENNLYRKCSTLPIENFYGILNTKNFAWLYKTFEDGDEYEISEEDNKDLKSIWEEIHEDYIEKITNGSGSKSYTIIAQISEFETELRIVSVLLQIYNLKPSERIKEQILKWEYFPDDMEKSLKKMNSLKFKISIIKSKNKDIFNPDEEDLEEKIEYDLFNDVVVLEQSLGEGRVIDVKTTVVEKWIKYVQSAEAKAKRNKK